MHKKLRLNTVTSLLFEIVSIVSGFILPRLIIKVYGSSVNGLVNSITQFIGLVSFLDLGVGKVVQSALYKPLAIDDKEQISRVIASARKFFRHIAQIMLFYIAIIIIIYPYISGKKYSWLYSAILIMAMSISSFAQYYFGIVNSLLLTADQRGYIQYTAQIITLVLNTIASAGLISMGFSIHVVIITSSLIFLARPLFLSWYVHTHYDINYTIKYEVEPIKQKWNGLAQHISYVVLNNTDTIVLTAFGSFSDISVYSVYHLVVYGVKRLFSSMMNGIGAYLGELWAKENEDQLQNVFAWTEWIVHTAVVLIFGCTGFLIIPFVQCYTKDIIDTNYIQPVFAALIVVAHSCHCLRLPYNLMIFAAGHYKQTQSNYITATIINLVISIAFVKLWGLIGVAIGTFISMAYQTVWMAVYNSKYLIKRSIKVFIKQCLVDILTLSCYFLMPISLELNIETYIKWIELAVKTTLIFAFITIVINLIFYKKYCLAFLKRIRLRIK